MAKSGEKFDAFAQDIQHALPCIKDPFIGTIHALEGDYNFYIVVEKIDSELYAGCYLDDGSKCYISAKELQQSPTVTG